MFSKNLMHLYYLPITCVFLSFTDLLSQEDISEVDELYKVELVYSNDLEMPGDFHGLTIDSSGYLWLANSSFLGCYDGNKLVAYSNGNLLYPFSPKEKDLGFYEVEITDQGHLMLGSWAGESSYTYNPYERKKLTQIIPDTINRLGGFFEFSAKGDVYYACIRKDTLSLKKYFSTNEDSTIYKRLGKYNGYDFLSTERYNWLLYLDSLKGFSLNNKEKVVEEKLSFTSALGLNKDQIYLYDYSTNSIKYFSETDGKLLTYYQLPDAIKRNVEKFLIVGNFIFIGSSRSFFVVNTETHTYQDLTNELKKIIEGITPIKYGNSLRDIYFKDSTTIYFLTNKSLLKLSRSSGLADQHLEKNDQSELLSFRKITEDQDKNIYASYYLGVLKKGIQNSAFSSYLSSEDIQAASKSTYDLKYWKGHLIWNNALVNLKDDSVSFLGEESYSGHCNTLLDEDSLWIFKWWSKGDFWMVDLDTKLSKKVKLKYLTTTGELGRLEMVNAMVFDQQKTIWLASRWQGIFQYSNQGKLLDHYDYDELGIYRIETGPTSLVHMDSVLWIGHHTGLLKIRLSDRHKENFKFPDIEKDRAIYSIKNLDNGILICGTNKGLIRFNTKEETYAYLSKDSPLGSVQYNRNSTFEASDGKLYFGSTSGLYSFYPDELDWIYPGQDIAPIHVDRVSYFDNRKKLYIHSSSDLLDLDELQLKPYYSNISISLSLVSLDNPVFFSYRLEGFSDEWSSYNSEGELNLFNLPPGRHKLQLRASYTKSDTNFASRDIIVNVAQVWYKRPWVISIFCLAFTSIVLGLMRWRYSSKMKRNKERELLRVKISSDLHDDVGTILSGLAMQSEIMSMQVKEKKEELLALSSQSREAMEKMRDTVWAIDSRKDHVFNLVDRMKEYAYKVINRDRISIDFDLKDDDLDQRISPDVRQNLYLIFKEAVNNSLKYSDGNQIIVTLRVIDNELYLKVKDNGSQQENKVSDGLGLQNMKMRSKNIGANFEYGYADGFYIELSNK